MASQQVGQSLTIIVLAAGASSRLGQPKQLVRIAGQTLLERQCRLALSITQDVYVVLGFQATEIADVIAHLPVTVIENVNWQLGMGSSIAASVSEIANNAERIMLLLVDQWRLEQHTLSDMCKAMATKPNHIVCVQDDYGNQGPPVIFPKWSFEQLSALKPQQGAKSLLNRYKTELVSLIQPNAFIDLDTPEQLQQCLAYFQVSNSELD